MREKEEVVLVSYDLGNYMYDTICDHFDEKNNIEYRVPRACQRQHDKPYAATAREAVLWLADYSNAFLQVPRSVSHELNGGQPFVVAIQH